jgi:hypothetical protein
MAFALQSMTTKVETSYTQNAWNQNRLVQLLQTPYYLWIIFRNVLRR